MSHTESTPTPAQGDSHALNSDPNVAASENAPRIREVGFLAPFRWLKLGLRDMRARAGESIFFGFCFAAMGMAITLVFEHAYQYTSAMSSGFLLMGPFLAIGLYEISRQQAYNTPRPFSETLTIWRHNAGNIGVFSLVLTVIFLLWARASLIVFALFFTDEMPNLTGFLQQVTSTENLEFIAGYCSVGLLFAALVFAVSIVSIPFMLDKNRDAITAMFYSIAALARNPAPCALWAVLIVILTLLGFASFHVGLIFVMPLIGHATWHAYADLIGHTPVGPRPE